MRRPGLVAAATALVMLAAAAPALRAEWTPVDATVIPKDKTARIAADRLAAEFADQDTDPVTVVVSTAVPRRSRPSCRCCRARRASPSPCGSTPGRG